MDKSLQDLSPPWTASMPLRPLAFGVSVVPTEIMSHWNRWYVGLELQATSPLFSSITSSSFSPAMEMWRSMTEALRLRLSPPRSKGHLMHFTQDDLSKPLDSPLPMGQ